MRYLSVCSGVEAATVAWHPMGWEAAAFSEIEQFPRDVLNFHYPNVPLHGDFTTIGENDYGAIDLLVGGTPCQSFSVAGLRKGFADDRGNLTLAFLQLLKRKAPKWVVWENVPGVLSHDRGRTFATFLRGLGECGYGFAYRVLDAQYFGVPQRRRRVFVVGCLGDWRSPAKVLFEPESLCGNITPRRKKRQEIAGTTAKCLTRKGAGGENHCPNTANFVISTAHTKSNGSGITKNISYTLEATNSCNQAIAMGFSESAGVQSDIALTIEGVPTLTKSHSMSVCNLQTVRRLTPLECERLQGFPDNYTNIQNAKDGPRYKALGNSMAVPVMKWIGERIERFN